MSASMMHFRQQPAKRGQGTSGLTRPISGIQKYIDWLRMRATAVVRPGLSSVASAR
jgi:hypothetical protein